ncbi:hypothetical protein [Amycolatopsis methanolica]
MVLLAREALRNPAWPLHAAETLDPGSAREKYPWQYLRAAPAEGVPARRD